MGGCLPGTGSHWQVVFHEDWSLCVCVCVGVQEAGLTLGEAWRVVVDIREGDADRRGSRESAHLSGHVFSLDHDLVVLFDFPVHAGQGGLDQAWWKNTQIFLCQEEKSVWSGAFTQLHTICWLISMCSYILIYIVESREFDFNFFIYTVQCHKSTEALNSHLSNINFPQSQVIQWSTFQSKSHKFSYFKIQFAFICCSSLSCKTENWLSLGCELMVWQK